ncbi:hypothetical protein GGQ73_003586 [Rhizobium skierniewicense]|uniref:Uncharacterized protein n=1 Tax=Rhizobium skierniewicense TaxID=984260 RepID=A0A7W6C8D5_9HYPH|nr:hypothetical protein [Rhizobium skierniewicense]
MNFVSIHHHPISAGASGQAHDFAFRARRRPN